jgi:hypothetical protein
MLGSGEGIPDPGYVGDGRHVRGAALHRARRGRWHVAEGVGVCRCAPAAEWACGHGARALLLRVVLLRVVRMVCLLVLVLAVVLGLKVLGQLVVLYTVLVHRPLAVRHGVGHLVVGVLAGCIDRSVLCRASAPSCPLGPLGACQQCSVSAAACSRAPLANLDRGSHGIYYDRRRARWARRHAVQDARANATCRGTRRSSTLGLRRLLIPLLHGAQRRISTGVVAGG